MRGHFRPEFVNRVDEYIVFDPLDFSQVRKIVVQQIERVRQRMADRKIGLAVTEEAVAMLCEAGYDPAFGARPVKRAVQHLLETALAQAILRGDVEEEDTAVVSVAHDDSAGEVAQGGGGYGGGGGGASGMRLVVTRQGETPPPQPPMESFAGGGDPTSQSQFPSAPPIVPSYDPSTASAPSAPPPSNDPGAYDPSSPYDPARPTGAGYDPYTSPPAPSTAFGQGYDAPP